MNGQDRSFYKPEKGPVFAEKSQHLRLGSVSESQGEGAEPFPGLFLPLREDS